MTIITLLYPCYPLECNEITTEFLNLGDKLDMNILFLLAGLLVPFGVYGLYRAYQTHGTKVFSAFALAPAMVPAEITASIAQTGTLAINIDTASLFDGANLIIAALGTIFLFLAGLALGGRILGAIVSTIQGLRF